MPFPWTPDGEDYLVDTGIQDEDDLYAQQYEVEYIAKTVPQFSQAQFNELPLEIKRYFCGNPEKDQLDEKS